MNTIRFNPEKPDGTTLTLTDPLKIDSLKWHHQIDFEI